MKPSGIVTAGHEKTAEAAIEILKAGGNAFDAILAGGFAACVAESVLASLGGGGFLLGRSAAGQEVVYDFFVQTPRHLPDKTSLDFYPIEADFGPTKQEFHIGLGATATPGMIAGFFQAHRDMGRLPLKEVIAPAISLCRDGVTINAFQEYLFTVVAPIYFATEEARMVFGSKKKPGALVLEKETLRFSELAQSLEVLVQEGPDLFYRGDAAKNLVEQCREGGALRADDLANYQVFRRKPLEFFYRGHRLLTNPSPSCGGTLIAFSLELLDRAGTTDFTFGSVADLESLARAMDQTNRARLTVTRGTTHLNVSDGEGNVASLSLSNGEGCGHLWKGTGIMLNNMLGEEDLNPAGFHQWQTDQRMASMMAPTILLMKDGTTVATGSGGSNRLRTAIIQVLKNLIDHRMPVSDAVESPRIHYERGLLSMEPGFSQAVLEELKAHFPQHHLWEEKNLFFGGVHTLTTHPKLGFSGSGDPRRFGVCRIL